MATARILVADDHEATREEISQAIEQDAGFTVCAVARDAPEAVKLAIATQPDLCLLDIRMPGGGIAAAWEIRARLPTSHVVMLTVSEDDGDLFRALRAGASGYLLKDIHPQRLPRALESVLAGEVALPRALVGRVVERFRDRQARRRSPLIPGPEGQLTSREWQVLELLRDGLGTAEIARELVLSPITVRTHVAAIMRKLHADDREDLRLRLEEIAGR